MNQEELVTVSRKDFICFVEIARPSQRNAISVQVIEKLRTVARELREEREILAVILSGRGGYFSAGADLKDTLLFPNEVSAEDQLYYGRLGAETVRAWESLPQITFAAIEGFAVGGGFAFALACDFRVMCREAFIYIPEIGLGSTYGWNSVPRLVSMIGPSRTKQLILFEPRVKADQALDWGLADFLADEGTAVEEARKLASVVAGKRRLAVQLTKRSVNSVARAFDEIGASGDMEQAVLCLLSEGVST